MQLKLLKQFYCDECGEVIHNIEDGWLEWIDDYKNPIHGFRIVHLSSASPRKRTGNNCYYPENANVSDMHLYYFTGSDGLSHLLALFNRNLRHKSELIEIIKRLHLPYYEEARFYLERAIDDSFIDRGDLSEDSLKQLLEEYATD